MIRIRFFGPGELNQNGFSRCAVWHFIWRVGIISSTSGTFGEVSKGQIKCGPLANYLGKGGRLPGRIIDGVPCSRAVVPKKHLKD